MVQVIPAGVLTHLIFHPPQDSPGFRGLGGNAAVYTGDLLTWFVVNPRKRGNFAVSSIPYLLFLSPIAFK